jgi:hypothetical protein
MVSFMSWLQMLLYSCAPIFVQVAVVAVAVGYALKLLFRFSHIPNYVTASPAAYYQWRRLAPPDIIFRLASLAAINIVLYWMPVYYWTTYEPCGDDRDGSVLFPSMFLCPVTWVLAVLCYAQVWRCWRSIAPRYRMAFHCTSVLLLLTALSTLIPQAEFYVRISRFSL